MEIASREIAPLAASGEVAKSLVSSNMLRVLVALAMVAGIITDVQTVALSPLVGTMAEDLKLSSAQVSWTINILAVGMAISIGLTARLGDSIGHRKVLIPLAVAGFVGAIACAVASSFELLMAGRFLMGTAAAMPLAWGLLRPRASASRMQSASVSWGVANAAAVPVALVLGGVMLSLDLSWKGVFWIIAALYVVALALAIIVPESPGEGRRRVRLDTVGAIGLGLWLSTLLTAISQGQTLGWGSTTIVALFAAAAVLFVLWIVQQTRAPLPLMAFHRADLRQMVSGYTSVVVIGFTAASLYVYVPAFLQMPSEAGYGFGLTVLQSSIPLLSLLPAAFAAGAIARFGVPRFGPRAVLAGAGVCGGLAFVGLGLFHDAIWLFYVWVFFEGLGIVTAYTVGTGLTAASGRQDNMSITFGLYSASAALAGAIATALVLVTLTPNSAGAIPEQHMVTGIVGTGIAVLAFAALWVFLVPKKLVDNHAALTDEEEIAELVALSVDGAPAPGRVPDLEV